MQQPGRLILKDAYKQFQHDQDKIMAPQATVDHFKKRLNDTGLKLLDEIVRIDNGRLGIPVYFSVCGPDARAAIGNFKQMGKGATPAQAQASAVMELGERFSLFSFYQNSANFIHAPQNALKAPAISFEQIARSVSDDSGDLPTVRRFFEQLPLQWTWAHSLTQDRPVMIPFNWFWTINEFNGASAGNCNEEAVCQGICEVVERHASALVSRNRTKVPRIDASSVQDGAALELIAKYHSAGIQLYLSDFTSHMGIPTVSALAWDPSTFPQKSEIVWTAGTSSSPAKALCRALTEVAQLAGDFDSGGNYVASGLPKFRHPDAADYIIEPGRTVALGELPDLSDQNIKAEVLNCVSALAQRKMEVFLVDVRHPTLSIPAFYTIIPGTQFRERAAQSSVGMMCAKILSESVPPSAAIAKLEEFRRILPDKYYTYFYLGQIHLNQGDYTNAITCLNKAADLGAQGEDLAAIWTYLGICHKDLGAYHAALEVLGNADRIDPERTDTLNLMGFCHFKLKAFEDAIKCFERVIALNPSSAIDYANLAVNHRALGHTQKAIELYRLSLALDPGIEFAREHLAQLES